MGRLVRVRTKDKIRRKVKGKHLVVRYPGMESDAELLDNGTVKTYGKYDTEIILNRDQVVIIRFL